MSPTFALPDPAPPEGIPESGWEDGSGGEESPHYVVGIGASAGGLEALDRLFRSMPEETGMSFVIVQHLSPDFESHMDQLLRRVTRIPVEVVDDGVRVEPDRIYLIPPKMEMVISNGKLLLTERSPERILTHPIDQFFRALAQDLGRYSIGIVLSGTGSDGSRGTAEIAANDGLVIVQDPATCKFDAMPRNAQQAGHVHLVVPPEAIGETLRRYTVGGHPLQTLQQRELEDLAESGMKSIFQMLRRTHGIDFTHYKSGTVGRRVQRRIELLGLGGLDQYVERLRSTPSEISELYKDLLIGVTRFFRDSAAFDVLEKQVLPELIERAEETIRIWVCGCATGEEAYSIAILMTEAIERSGRNLDFKMFATDVHRESLQFAAAGIYDESRMDEVSEERRERFFNRRRDGYFVTNELRRSVVFAPQNVINDPPFTQMHLVTCRNMLIYLEPLAQKKTLSLFHFALKAHGVLFLGPSETAGEIGDEFEAIDTHWKIFRKRRDVRLPVDLRMPLLGQLQPATAVSAATAGNDYADRRQVDALPEVYDLLLGELMPPSILVDTNLQVLHVFGGLDHFLRIPSGRPTRSLLDMVYPAIKTSVAAASQHALKVDATVRYSGMPHPDGDPDQQVRLTVRPIHLDTSKQTCLLVQFESAAAVATPPPPLNEQPVSEINVSEAAASRIDSLERELSYSRQNLQATIEELETSNEELQASNEEMVAANEELQSTNEELHSVNEELYTVNAEHQARVAELDEANADMNNLLATTRVGVVFLDTEFYVRRFTPEIGRLFSMEPQDIGRSIEGFTERIADDTFMERLQETFSTRREQEWEINCGGSDYLVRALPYWAGSSLAGVVIAFINVDALRKAQDEVAQFKFMADENIDAQILIGEDARIRYANRKMCDQLGYSSDELKSMSFFEFDLGHNREGFRRRFDAAHSTGGDVFESRQLRKGGSEVPVEVAITPVTLKHRRYVFASIRDITLRQEKERQMRLLSNAVSAAANGIVITDYQKPDNPIIFVNEGFVEMTGYDADECRGRNCRFLQGEGTDPKVVANIRAAIERGDSIRTLIRNYRKDGTAFWNDLYVTPVCDDTGTVTHFVGVQNDVTERIAVGETAKANERTIRLLLDSTAEGIFGLNAEGVCSFCNQSAVRMLGYDNSSELVGERMHQLIQATHCDGSEYPLEASTIHRALREGRRENRSDEVFCRQDGTQFPVEYWCYPIVQNEQVIGAVVTFVDISQRQKVETELKEAKQEAEAANQAKSRFLANMSHELRTPLSAILGFAKIIEEEHDDPQLHEKLTTIRRNGDYLLRLLGDLLDLSRIEADKFQTSKSSVVLSEFLSDLHVTMQMRAKEYENELHFELRNPLPETVTTDAARLRQILINLIANALKFSPKGNVHVRFEVDPDADAATLKISVRDTGIGIEKHQLETLFEPFVQADRSITHRFGGTGLGLSITRRLVSALGGTLTVTSEVGQGSEFTVRVPVNPVGPLEQVSLEGDDDSKESPPTRRIDPSLRDIQLDAKVLIADDMRDVRFIAKHFLRKANCQVDVAENGRQAVDMIVRAQNRGEPFELCLMDMQMPELDGVQAVRELRRRGIEIPVIALTADAMKGTRRRLIAEGFDEYLSKPLHVSRLIQIAHSLLQR